MSFSRTLAEGNPNPSEGRSPSPFLGDDRSADRRSEDDHASWPTLEARPRVRTQWRLPPSGGRRNYLTWEIPRAVARSDTQPWALDPRRRGGAREYPRPGFGRR